MNKYICVFWEHHALLSWDSAVGISTDYSLDSQGIEVQVLVGSRIFSSHHPDQL
jgi:hypothetical protein